MTPHRLYLELGTEHVGVRVECPGGDDRQCKIFMSTDVCHCDCEVCAANEHYECLNEDQWPTLAHIDGPGCKLEETTVCGVMEYLGDISIEDMLHGYEADWTYAADGAALARVGWTDGVPTLTPWIEE